MNILRNTLAIAWKDFQIIIRDRGLLVVIILLPLLFGGLLSMLYTSMYSSGDGEGQANISINLFLVNLDDGAYGAKVVEAMKEIDMLSIEELSGQAGVEQADQQVADGLKTALVVIPQDFSQKIEEYQQTQVSIIGDPTQKTLTDVLAGLMNYAITSASLEGNLRYGIRSLFGQSEVLKQASTEQLAGLEAQTLGAIMTQLQKMFFEPLIVIEAEQQVEEQAPMTINFFTLFMPGFTVMFAFFLVGAIGQSIFNEKDSGTIRRLLVAPIHKGTLIGGKMLAFGILIVLQVIILLGLPAVLFDMSLGSSPLGLVLVTIALALTVTSFGLMVAALSKTGKQADSIGTLLGFLLAGLGGCIFMSIPPIYRMDTPLGFVSRLTPHAHALEGYYIVMFEGGSVVDVLPQVGILLVFALVFFLIASRRLKLG